MRIAIMGAGGVGGYVGLRLAAAGQDVAIVARGAHLAAIRENGLRLLSPRGDAQVRVRAEEDPAAVGPVDLVIFAVKLWDAESAAASIRPMLAEPASRVVTLQNGIESVDLIARQLPAAQVVGGCIYVTSLIEAPGVIRQTSALNRIIVGRPDDPVIADFAARKVDGLDIEATADIEIAVWEKFIRLSSFSAATSLMRARIGAIRSDVEGRKLLIQLVEEALAVARASGRPIRDSYFKECIDLFDSMAPGARTSMSEDLEAGRRLELPFLSGRVHHLGVELGVPTPAHSTAYRALALYANGTPRAG
jgi:2-dehydropantoate 2-reductase